MPDHGRLRFTEGERQFEQKGRFDKTKLNRRRQEKQSRREVSMTEGSGDIRAEIFENPGGINSTAVMPEESRTPVITSENRFPERTESKTGRTLRDEPEISLQRRGSSGFQKAAQIRDPGKGPLEKAKFRESPENPPSKMIHKSSYMAEDTAANMYQRAKALNREDRNPETSERVMDTGEQGMESTIRSSRIFFDSPEKRTERQALFNNENNAPEPAKKQSGRLQFREETGSVHTVKKKRTVNTISARERENIRLIEEVDRLKHPWAYETKASRIQQRRFIRSRYAAKARARRRRQEIAAAVRKSIQTAQKTAGDTVKGAFVIRHPILMLVLILIAAAALAGITQGVGIAISSNGTISALLATTYPSEDAEMLLAEKIYSQMEKDLQFELDNYEDLHPNYDEYHFDLDPIGHDPYVLISLISAKEGGAWEAEAERTFMEELFQKQYQLTEEVETEIRTREVEKKDPLTGEMITETEEYEYRIITVTLENMDLAMATTDLSDEEKGMYAAYMATLGNRPDLFGAAEYPNASVITYPEYYDIPESALSDEQFAAMIKEAEKYLGYPYVWGGSSPETSFDCSGFVSWVLNHSGWNVGRQTAEGLRSLCTPIAPDAARPGDLIFFQNTYNTPGASHVGIYVGNGMMIHCGNPISYTSINTGYWQSHFLQFGRI